MLYQHGQCLVQIVSYTKCFAKQKQQQKYKYKITAQHHDYHHSAELFFVAAHIQWKEIRTPQHEQQNQQTGHFVSMQYTVGGINVCKKSKNKKEITLQDKITQALGRLDLLLKENFELRREIVFERKKYVDL